MAIIVIPTSTQDWSSASQSIASNSAWASGLISATQAGRRHFVLGLSFFGVFRPRWHSLLLMTQARAEPPESPRSSGVSSASHDTRSLGSRQDHRQLFGLQPVVDQRLARDALAHDLERERLGATIPAATAQDPEAL